MDHAFLLPQRQQAAPQQPPLGRLQLLQYGAAQRYEWTRVGQEGYRLLWKLSLLGHAYGLSTAAGGV